MELHFEKYGEETEELLFVFHGLFGNLKNWASISKALSLERQVVAADLRGHGNSTYKGRIDYRTMAEDMGRLFDLFPQKRFSVLAHSMGGKAAMFHVLEKQPARLEKLIVVDIAPVIYPDTGFYGGLIDTLLTVPLDEGLSKNELSKRLAPKIGDAALTDFLLTNLVREDGQYRWRIDLKGLRESVEEILGFPDTSAQFSGKTCFIAGERSDYVTHANFKKACLLFPVAKLSPIKNAGHWVHAEAKEEFLRVVSDFLKHLPPR